MLKEASEISKALVDRVGLSKSYASLLVNGKKTPSLKTALKIEELCGIPPKHWLKNEPEQLAS